jgi:hypothetical protein
VLAANAGRLFSICPKRSYEAAVKVHIGRRPFTAKENRFSNFRSRFVKLKDLSECPKTIEQFYHESQVDARIAE